MTVFPFSDDGSVVYSQFYGGFQCRDMHKAGHVEKNGFRISGNEEILQFNFYCFSSSLFGSLAGGNKVDIGRADFQVSPELGLNGHAYVKILCIGPDKSSQKQ